MFMSQYNHTVDAKGRLIVPSKFRDRLGDEFVVTKGMDGCLFVYANDDWAAFEEKLAQLPMSNKEARMFTRFFLAGAAPLREFAQLEKDVVLVGVGTRIEIWSKENWESMDADKDMDDIAAAMEGLGLSI